MTDQDQDGDDRIRMDPPAALRVPAREMLLRFGFGAGVSTLAGVVSRFGSGYAGGILLAFPAIALASLTLVADKDGLRLARDDARGAALGTLGLVAFAVTCWELLPRTSAWWALIAAASAWAAVSGIAYLVVRLLGHGTDEPGADEGA